MRELLTFVKNASSVGIVIANRVRLARAVKRHAEASQGLGCTCRLAKENRSILIQQVSACPVVRAWIPE